MGRTHGAVEGGAGVVLVPGHGRVDVRVYRLRDR